MLAKVEAGRLGHGRLPSVPVPDSWSPFAPPSSRPTWRTQGFDRPCPGIVTGRRLAARHPVLLRRITPSGRGSHTAPRPATPVVMRLQDSVLSLDPHFHAPVVDGVFVVPSVHGCARFQPSPARTDEMLPPVTANIVRQLLALLRDRGPPRDDEDGSQMENERNALAARASRHVPRQRRTAQRGADRRVGAARPYPQR